MRIYANPRMIHPCVQAHQVKGMYEHRGWPARTQPTRSLRRD